jgi:hypothetical protein
MNSQGKWNVVFQQQQLPGYQGMDKTLINLFNKYWHIMFEYAKQTVTFVPEIGS